MDDGPGAGADGTRDRPGRHRPPARGVARPPCHDDYRHSRRRASVPGVDEVIHPDDLDSVASRVDAVISTLPGTDATTGLLDRSLFTALQAEATVVNVGRGTVIDEAAL